MHRPHPANPSAVFRLFSSHPRREMPFETREDHLRENQRRARAHIVKRYQRRWRFIVEIVGKKRDDREFHWESRV